MDTAPTHIVLRSADEQRFWDDTFSRVLAGMLSACNAYSFSAFHNALHRALQAAGEALELRRKFTSAPQIHDTITGDITHE